MQNWPARRFRFFFFVALLLTAPMASADDEASDGTASLFVSLVENFASPDLTKWTWNGEEWVCNCKCDCDCCDCEWKSECNCECCECDCDNECECEDCDCECEEECECDCCDCSCDCGDPPQGSPLLIISIGTFLVGENLDDTRFVPGQPLFDEMPNQEDDNHQYTILGSVNTAGNTEHLISPMEGPVPARVQVAFFNASNAVINPDADPPVIGFAALGSESTTLDVAVFIFEHRGPGGVFPEPPPDDDTSIQEIMQFLFTPQDTDPDNPEPPQNPNLGDCNSPCMAEGELFGHQDGLKLFDYSFTINLETGEVEVDACAPVTIDVRNKKINLKSKGRIRVAILSHDSLDAPEEVNECTVEIGGVFADKFQKKDVNKDKKKDLICKFKIQDLVCAGVLDECTTSLTLHALLNDDSCIEGTDDSVKIKGKDDDCGCDEECDEDCDCDCHTKKK